RSSDCGHESGRSPDGYGDPHLGASGPYRPEPAALRWRAAYYHRDGTSRGWRGKRHSTPDGCAGSGCGGHAPTAGSADQDDGPLTWYASGGDGRRFFRYVRDTRKIAGAPPRQTGCCARVLRTANGPRQTGGG